MVDLRRVHAGRSRPNVAQMQQASANMPRIGMGLIPPRWLACVTSGVSTGWGTTPRPGGQFDRSTLSANSRPSLVVTLAVNSDGQLLGQGACAIEVPFLAKNVASWFGFGRNLGPAGMAW